jgi:hypothetical protein
MIVLWLRLNKMVYVLIAIPLARCAAVLSRRSARLAQLVSTSKILPRVRYVTMHVRVALDQVYQVAWNALKVIFTGVL